GTGPIARFRLLINPSAPTGGTIAVGFDPDRTRLNDGDIPVLTSDGLITLGTFIWGDVACPLDGIPGTLDVAAILRYDAFMDDDFACAVPPTTRPDFPQGGDVNADGIMGVL